LNSKWEILLNVISVQRFQIYYILRFTKPIQLVALLIAPIPDTTVHRIAAKFTRIQGAKILGIHKGAGSIRTVVTIAAGRALIPLMILAAGTIQNFCRD